MTIILGWTKGLQLIQVEIFWLSLVGVWLLYSLLAFWLSKRSWHWFISIAVISAAVSMLRIIEANDLMLMQFSNCLSVFFAFTIWKRVTDWRSRQHKNESVDEYPIAVKSKLSLANLLLLVAAIAIVFSMLTVDLTGLESRFNSIGFGLAIGLAFTFGFGVASGSRSWAILATLPFVAFGIYKAYGWIFPGKTSNSIVSAILGSSFIWSELAPFGQAVLLTAFDSGWACGLLQRMSSQAKGKVLLATRVATRVAIGLVGIVVLLLGVALIDVGVKLSHRYSNPEARQQKLPDGLAQIANRFWSSQILNDYPPADEVTLQTEVAAFKDEFFNLREILDRDDVKRKPSQEFDLKAEVEDVQEIRAVARALSTKARFEFAAKDFDQSLADSILIVRLRRPLSQKMTLMSELVALAVEGIGHFSAAESVGFASRSATEEALQQLLELDAKTYDPELIYETDQEICWNAAVWWGRLSRLCDKEDSRGVFDQVVMETVRRVLATRQQVIAMLALELYRHDHGTFPPSLETLVPRYLALVPHDPFRGNDSSQPLSYKQLDNGNDYWLYSIGFDRNDDEGQVGEFGYASTSEGEDLNFKESAKLNLIERDQELIEAAAEAADAEETKEAGE